MGISLYSTRVVLNALGATDFGLYSLIGGVISMLTFLNNSMTQATQRFLNYNLGAGNVNRLHEIFNASVYLHLIIGVLVVILVESAGFFAFDYLLTIPAERIDSAKLVFHLSVVSTFFTIISVPYDGVINAHEHMLFDAVLGIIQSLGVLAIALVVSSFESDRFILYGVLMVSLMIAMLLIRRTYCNIHYSESKVNFKKYLKKETINEMINYAKYTLLSAVSSMIGFYGLPVIINAFFNPKINASYGIAGQINGQISVFSATMMKAISPQITKSEGGNNRIRMLKLTLTGSKFGVLLLAIFALPFIVEAPFILRIWLSNPPDYAIVFCQCALIVSLLSQLSLPLLNSINAVGNIKGITLASSLVFISVIPIMVMCYYFGGKPWYLYPVLIFSEIVLLMIRLYYAKRIVQLNVLEFTRNVVRPLAFVIMFVCLFVLPIRYYFNEGWGRLFAVLMASSSVFLLAIYYFALSKDEKNALNNFKNSILSRIN